MTSNNTEFCTTILGVEPEVPGTRSLGVKKISETEKHRALAGFRKAKSEDRRTKLRETKGHNASPEVQQARSSLELLLVACYKDAGKARISLVRRSNSKGTDMAVRDLLIQPASFGARLMLGDKPAPLPSIRALKEAIDALIKVEILNAPDRLNNRRNSYSSPQRTP